MAIIDWSVRRHFGGLASKLWDLWRIQWRTASSSNTCVSFLAGFSCTTSADGPLRPHSLQWMAIHLGWSLQKDWRTWAATTLTLSSRNWLGRRLVLNRPNCTVFR